MSILLALLGCFGAPTPPVEIPESTFEALPEAGSWVSLRGQAHYDARIVQRRAASIFTEARSDYVFGFFPEHATEDRRIRVLLRTQREPERLVSYETMTVEGQLVPITEADLSGAVQEQLFHRTGYYLADDAMRLDVVRILSEDGVWEEQR